MRRVIFLMLCTGFLMASCKKDANVKITPPVINPPLVTVPETLSSTAARSLRGVNWACDDDNFSDGILVLSGLTSSDSYSTVLAKATAVLSGIQTNTGANTIRIPINYSTASTSWWSCYTGVIDAAVSKGMNVIIAYWESKSSENGLIDNDTQFWSMWQTAVGKYGGNSHVYFEIMNEPHGYTLTAWTTICAKWLSNYPSVPQGHILIDGTSYAQDITGVGADNRFVNCLLSIHDYAFFSNGTLTTAAQWESRLKGNVGSYGNRAVLTEFGDVMNSGINYTGAIGGIADNAYIQGLTNEVRTLGMGSVYWPGIRNGDSYAMLSLGGNTGNPTVTTTNVSGLSRLKFGWGVGTGGTDVFYPGAYYRFLNLKSGEALDVNSASTASGAAIIQWPQNGGNNQQWTIAANGSYYTITNRNSGDVLDVNGASTASDAGIIQSASNGGNSQQWQLATVSTSVYKVINRNSGLVLDVSGASVANGTGIIQLPWKGDDNQQWTVVQQ